MLDENSRLWQYLSPNQKDLIKEGYYLVEDSKSHVPIHPITDYAYLVFPFAKAYEGFLKQALLDLKFIKKWQYDSDHLRIGKILSPELAPELKHNSVYTLFINKLGSSELANNLWQVWREGRNRVFHYFPHNLAAISLVEAERLIANIVRVMERTVEVCKLAR